MRLRLHLAYDGRPFRGWQENKRDYQFARLLCRARYYPGTPRGVTRIESAAISTSPSTAIGRNAASSGAK